MDDTVAHSGSLFESGEYVSDSAAARGEKYIAGDATVTTEPTLPALNAAPNGKHDKQRVAATVAEVDPLPAWLLSEPCRRCR